MIDLDSRHAGETWFNSHPLANDSVGDSFAHFFDDARRFVPKDQLSGHSVALPVVAVGATDSCRDDLDKDIVVTNRFNRSFLYFDGFRCNPHASSVGGFHRD